MHFLQKTQTIQQSLSACEVRRVLFLIHRSRDVYKRQLIQSTHRLHANVVIGMGEQHIAVLIGAGNGRSFTIEGQEMCIRDRGYSDLKDPSVSGFFRFLAKVGDNGMKMQIVKSGFGGKL